MVSLYNANTGQNQDLEGRSLAREVQSKRRALQFQRVRARLRVSARLQHEPRGQVRDVVEVKKVVDI